MNCTNLVRRMFVIALAGFLLSGCGGEPTNPLSTPTVPPPTFTSTTIPATLALSPILSTATPSKPPETSIVIDGKGNDWKDYPVVGTDPVGDQVSGSPDLAEVRAFSNDKYFYLLIRLHQDGKTDHYDILMDVNGGNFDYQLSVWPSKNQAVFAAFPVQGGNMSPLLGVTTAQGDVIEVKMPLSAMDNRPVISFLAQTWLGNQVGDMITDLQAIVANETEPVALAQSPLPASTFAPPTAVTQPRTQRPVHYFMADPTTLGGYAYRSFLQIPVGMTWGPDGRLYVADFAGRHVVRVAPDGTMDDLDTWRDPNIWQQDGPRGVTFAPDGTLYVHDRNRIYRLDAQGKATALTGAQGTPIGSIIFGSDGSLYYTDMGAGEVRRWIPTGRSELVATGIPKAEKLVFGLDGTLYVSEESLDKIVKVNMKTNQVSVFVSPPLGNSPVFLAVDARGDIWIQGSFALYRYAPDGTQKSYVVDGKSYQGASSVWLWLTSGGIASDDKGGMWLGSYTSRLGRLAPVTSNQVEPAFTFTMVSPGLHAPGLAVGPQGEIYAANMIDNTLWRINPNGTVDQLVRDLPGRRTIVAVDPSGAIYLGLYNGIVRVESDGQLTPYAPLSALRMVFASDGTLYATVQNMGKPNSVVRITGAGSYQTVASAIDGISLGTGDTYISLAPNGLYIFTEDELNLFFMDLNGQGRRIANLVSLGRNVGPAIMTAAPNGEIFYLPHGPYKLYRLDARGNAKEYASGLYGDPWAMMVSPDGKWLYVAESGAIDRIPIAK